MNIKQDSFSDLLLKESFFLLVKPEDNIYSNTSKKNSFFEELGSLVKLGLKNIEISWSNNEKWLDFVSEIKLNFPQINLGSASIVNKQSIEEAINLNCNIIKIYPIKSKDSSIDILKL